MHLRHHYKINKSLLIWTKQNLLTNSSTDFEPNFETRNIYWYVLHQKFFIQCRVTRWRCNHFSKKWPKSNFDNTFTIKKPWVTPNFCNWKNSSMRYTKVINFLSPEKLLYLTVETLQIGWVFWRQKIHSFDKVQVIDLVAPIDEAQQTTYAIFSLADMLYHFFFNDLKWIISHEKFMGIGSSHAITVISVWNFTI